LAPPLLEDIYNFEDVLQVGCILNTFIRRADVVRIACIAQLVNVIAPIMTEPGGRAWRQTTFHPLYLASCYGRGAALNLTTRSPTYDADAGDEIPYLDISGVENPDGTLTFFAVNRHAEKPLDVEIRLEGYGPPSLVDHQTIRHKSLRAVNSAAKPNNVAPVKGAGAKVEDGVAFVRLPPHSYHMLRFAGRPSP
jgi:alpha-N-arabinofuranosidase